MNELRISKFQGVSTIFLVKCALLLVVGFWVGGCSIWNDALNPDYESTRAERVCHPYGECSQGKWVAVDGFAENPSEAKAQCEKAADKVDENGWWDNSVSKGLEIGRCMEQKGYRLQQ